VWFSKPILKYSDIYKRRLSVQYDPELTNTTAAFVVELYENPFYQADVEGRYPPHTVSFFSSQLFFGRFIIAPIPVVTDALGPLKMVDSAIRRRKHAVTAQRLSEYSRGSQHLFQCTASKARLASRGCGWEESEERLSLAIRHVTASARSFNGD
jgi:hypothetical protein